MKYFVNKKVLFMYVWMFRNKKYVFIDFYLYFNIICSFVDLKKKKRNCEVLYVVKCVLNYVVCFLFSFFI